MTSILRREKTQRETHIERRPQAHEGSDWNDVTMSHGAPTVTGNIRS